MGVNGKCGAPFKFWCDAPFKVNVVLLIGDTDWTLCLMMFLCFILLF